MLGQILSNTNNQDVWETFSLLLFPFQILHFLAQGGKSYLYQTDPKTFPSPLSQGGFCTIPAAFCSLCELPHLISLSPHQHQHQQSCSCLLDPFPTRFYLDINVCQPPLQHWLPSLGLKILLVATLLPNKNGWGIFQGHKAVLLRGVM